MGFHVPRHLRWPQGIIPYEIDPEVPHNVQAWFVQCMRRWELSVNEAPGSVGVQATLGRRYISFEPRTNQAGYFRLCKAERTDAGSLGIAVMRDWNQRGKIEFTLNCRDKALDEVKHIPHELGHIIGLAHEHQRDDSSLRPTPVWAEFRKPYGFDQAEKRLPKGSLVLDVANPRHAMALGAHTSVAYLRSCVKSGPYDIQSIMHYECPAGYEWVGPPPPIYKPDKDEVTQDRWRPSAGDIAAVRSLYF